VEGAANEEVVRFRAERLGVRRRAIAMAAGDTSRRKRVIIEGVEPAHALRLLENP